MTMDVQPQHVVLQDHVSVEEAEALLGALTAMEQPAVHLGGCGHVHAAALQVLLAVRPRIDAPPPDRWLASVLGLEGTWQP